jgi:hypothetical protein
MKIALRGSGSRTLLRRLENSSVTGLVHENNLKGWAFEPVLKLGTQSYEEYTELWSSFYGLLAQCEKHTVRGRCP